MSLDLRTLQPTRVICVKNFIKICRGITKLLLLENFNMANYETCLYKYIGNFTTKKTQDFSNKNSDIFHISAQNIDCGYLLELPR